MSDKKVQCIICKREIATGNISEYIDSELGPVCIKHSGVARMYIGAVRERFHMIRKQGLSIIQLTRNVKASNGKELARELVNEGAWRGN